MINILINNTKDGESKLEEKEFCEDCKKGLLWIEKMDAEIDHLEQCNKNSFRKTMLLKQRYEIMKDMGECEICNGIWLYCTTNKIEIWSLKTE